MIARSTAISNRLVAGVDSLNGDIDNRQYASGPMAVKGALLSSSLDKAKNTLGLCGEFVLLSAECRGCCRHAVPECVRAAHRPFSVERRSIRQYRFQSPESEIRCCCGTSIRPRRSSPISRAAPRSAELRLKDQVPLAIPFTRDPGSAGNDHMKSARVGRRADYAKDIALYRAEIHNELLCFSNPAAVGPCYVINADRTIHQGSKSGLGLRC